MEQMKLKMKYFIKYRHVSNPDGDINIEEYKTESGMHKTLGLLIGAGYEIIKSGRIEE